MVQHPHKSFNPLWNSRSPDIHPICTVLVIIKIAQCNIAIEKFPGSFSVQKLISLPFTMLSAGTTAILCSTSYVTMIADHSNVTCHHRLLTQKPSHDAIDQVLECPYPPV
ncbi:hypothetical protein QL285_095406 [Trifolium repens]|nr:hypothetical protein QL285_095406 [Trifolium repens]